MSRRTGAPGRIRTCGLWFRRPALYPLSYRRTGQIKIFLNCSGWVLEGQASDARDELRNSAACRWIFLTAAVIWSVVADLLVTPFGQMRLAGVLNDGQALLAGNGQNRIKVGDGPAQVNRSALLPTMAPPSPLLRCFDA